MRQVRTEGCRTKTAHDSDNKTPPSMEFMLRWQWSPSTLIITRKRQGGRRRGAAAVAKEKRSMEESVDKATLQNMIKNPATPPSPSPPPLPNDGKGAETPLATAT
ncbi:hypothetical protein HN51_037980 [Arachis hypogaea]